MSGALGVAERALAAIPRGVEAQATVTTERSLMLRFARSTPTQATSVDDLTVEVMTLRDGHTSSATTNSTDQKSLAACASASVAAAATASRSGADGRYPGLRPPAPLPVHDGHDPATAQLDPGAGSVALDAAFEVARAEGVEAHGIWTAAEVELGIASTAGVAAADRVTDAFMKVVAFAPGGRSGYAAAAGAAVDAIDPADLARHAARKATARGRAALPPGEYAVVLEHHAVGELLQWLGWLALNGLSFAEGRSAISGRIGRRVAAPLVNLSDSPRYVGTLPRAFDAEGTPKSPLPLVQDGVAHGVAHDLRSAALCGAASTGHALAPGGAPDGPAPTNLVLAGGAAEDSAALCRPIERGVYVTRLWYVNPVRPKETLVTGVTRDGTFLIEDGEVTRPLDELRMTDSVLGLLARVEDLTAGPELTSSGEFYGRRFATGVVCPALRASAMRFTA